MKKVRNYFAVLGKLPIFAPAILENRSGNTRFDILQDRQKGADLIESDKFLVYTSRLKKIALESSLACPVSFLMDTDNFTIFCDRVLPEPYQANM